MADTPVKMGKISYINAMPVYYGLDRQLLPPWLEMVPDVPAALNLQLKQGKIQISPISAAYYAMNHRDLLLLPDLSISCFGKVLSVILASDYPLSRLDGKTVVFSKESASAAAFMKMIFQKKGISPHYQVGDVRQYIASGDKADAVLIIGDHALNLPWGQNYEHVTDLGQLWYEMTQMPFVFAVWAVRRAFAVRYPEKVSEIWRLLIASREQGLANQAWVVEESSKRIGISRELARQYFDLLLCDMDDVKIKAMGMFFDSLYDQGVLKEKAGIEFFEPD